MRLAALCLVSAPLLASALPRALQPAGGAVASGTLPNLLIQYGQPRTATTLQFQTLCAIALVLNEAEPSRVRCSFLRVHHAGDPRRQSGGPDGAARCEDPQRAELRASRKTRGCLPRRSTRPSALMTLGKVLLSGCQQKLGHEVKYAQVMSRLAGRGSGIATEYQSFFGLSDAQLEEVVTYLRYWDILRMCCGAQMDDGYRAELGGGAGADAGAEAGLVPDDSQTRACGTVRHPSDRAARGANAGVPARAPGR